MGRLAGVAGFAVVMVLLSWAGNARADVVVRVDKSSQRMNAAVLFSLVQQQGLGNTRISIH